MLKALAVLAWPAGIAAILLVTARAPRRPAKDLAGPARKSGPPQGDGAGPADGAGPVDWRSLLLLLAVGAVLVYALTCLLGVLVVHAGPRIDRPVYDWTIHHRVHAWKAVMTRVTKAGDTWTTWGAAAAAAFCLAVFYRGQKWLPPVVLGAAVLVDHFLTLALRHTFERPGPPDSPLGTFPSGGCDRIIVFYGLIAYLIWREAGRGRPAAIWSAGVVAALGFSEAYSRGYLTLHWFTDILSGLVYGALILIAFITAIRLAGRPASKTAADRVPAVLP